MLAHGTFDVISTQRRQEFLGNLPRAWARVEAHQPGDHRDRIRSGIEYGTAILPCDAANSDQWFARLAPRNPQASETDSGIGIVFVAVGNTGP